MPRKAEKQKYLYETLRDSILDGKYRCGERFPKEVEFALSWGVSRKTLRAALKRLEEEKLIERLKSRGTFVRYRQILVWIDNNKDPHMPSNYIIPGLLRAAERRGFSVSICSCSELDGLEEEEISRSFSERNVSGCIVVTNRINEETGIWQKLRRQKLPIVLAHAHPMDHVFTGWPCVAFDEKDAWKTALRFLRNLGIRRLAVGWPEYMPQQIRGWEKSEFKDLLEQIGFDPEEVSYFMADTPGLRADQSLDALLEKPLRPEAVLCFSDFWAPAVYRAIRNRKLRIPEEIRVMGFCGAPIGRYLSPQLSTVDLQYERIGEIAVRMLVGEIREPLYFIGHKIVERESSGTKKGE